MPVSSLMAAVFSIIGMRHAGQLPGSSCATPSWLQPQGGQTYCFFSCAAAPGPAVTNVTIANEPATTNSLRFIAVSFLRLKVYDDSGGCCGICSEIPEDGVNGPKPVTKRYQVGHSQYRPR